MKLKKSFPGSLLPFWKHLKSKIKSINMGKDPELYFALGVVLLWLVIFILDILRPIKS
jgi:hypothetical protein